MAAIIFSPGVGLNLTTSIEYVATLKPPGLKGSVIIDIFPTNPIAAMAEGKMLQIISFFYIFWYVALRSIKDTNSQSNKNNGKRYKCCNENGIYFD